MSKIYEKLYEAAKLDSEAINVLNTNNLLSPAIYHCAQAVEKSSKAIHAYYLINFQNKNENEIGNQLKKSYGHGLKKSTRGIADILMKADIDDEIKKNPKLRGKEKQAYNSLKSGGDKIVKDVLGIDEIVVGFNGLADKMYNLYKNFDTIGSRLYNPTPDIVRKTLTDPDRKFYWYIFSAMLLSSFLDKLEKYSRYPMSEFSNNNITILNDHKNKFAITRIHEIISEMIQLVPLVWKQIDFYKKSLQKQR